MTRTVPPLVLALALAAPGAAAAQERLALSWTGPAPCPDAAAVRREVERLVGGSLPDGPEVAAEAVATAEGDGYRLALQTEMEGAHGERVLEGERCEELAAATALILALMIDPEAAARAEPAPGLAIEPPPEPASLAAALASPRTESTAESAIRSTATASRELAVTEPRAESSARSIEATAPTASDGLTGFVGAVGLVDVGTLPAPTFGATIEAGLGVPLVDGRLRATFLMPQPGASSVPGVGADLMAASVEARGCVRPFEEARMIGGCGGIAAGAVFGSGRGVADPQSGAGFWLAASVGLALAWVPVEWLDLELDADLLVPLYDSTFVVDLAGRDVEVFVPSDVAGRFGLAAHVRFR